MRGRCLVLRTASLVAVACLLAGGCAHGPRGGLDPTAATAAHFEGVRDQPARLREFLAAMPLGGDLHHHAGGSVPPDLLIRFAAEDGLCLPDDPAAAWGLEPPPCGPGRRAAAEALVDPELHAEIERRWSMRDFAADDPGIDRRAAHDHFFGLFGQIRLATRDLARVLAAIRSLAAADGVSYLETSTGWVPDWELRTALDATPWNPDLLAMRRRLLADPRFQTLRDATTAGLARQLALSDELLGCGSEERDPGCDVLVRFQTIAGRTRSPQSVFVQTLLGYEIAQTSPLVVGVNIVAPETHSVALRDYALHMRMLGQLAPLYPAVRRALHAGEMTDREAVVHGARGHIALAIAPVEEGGAAAHRIGHGVAINAESTRDAVLKRMHEEGIAVEINLRSNELLLGVTAAAHPLADYLAAGVPVVLSTDDAGLMSTDLREQFALAAEVAEVDYQTLKTFARNSLEVSFLATADKRRLQRQLERQLEAFEHRWSAP